MEFYCKQTYKNILHISVAFILAHHVCIFVCPHISVLLYFIYIVLVGCVWYHAVSPSRHPSKWCESCPEGCL